MGEEEKQNDLAIIIKAIIVSWLSVWRSESGKRIKPEIDCLDSAVVNLHAVAIECSVHAYQ
jgi:hypothetical protein